jgi:flavodoxin
MSSPKRERSELNYVVVYYSKGGHTRKIANAIAGELGVSAIDVKEQQADAAKADMLIVGSGTYGGKAGPEIIDFLNALAPVASKKAACFSTCAGNTEAVIAEMNGILKTKGYALAECFNCLGQFTLFKNRGRPNEEDVQKAKEYASCLKRAI